MIQIINDYTSSSNPRQLTWMEDPVTHDRHMTQAYTIFDNRVIWVNIHNVPNKVIISLGTG